MFKAKLALSSALLLAGSGLLLAQDPVKTEPQHYKVLLENASVRVLQVDYAAGTKSAMHQHPDNVVITLSAAKVRFTMPDKTTKDSELPSEGAMYAAAGTHAPNNIGTTAVKALVVEFKGAGGKATLPASRDNMSLKVLAEGPRAIVQRVTAAPGFAEPAGSKHDYDQVVIPLGPASMSLSIDGKPAKTTWTRGEAVFIGRGTAHESRNTGAKPVDFIIVSIK